MSKLAVNIVGRIDAHTGIAQHTKAFASCLRDDFEVNFLDTRPESSETAYLPHGVRAFSAFDNALTNAEVSIFVDVTCNDADDKKWQRVPVTKRKYIYSVFDSTLMPKNWADIMNNHFDAVFVPSRFLVDVCKNSMVHKPVFYLPLALDLQPFSEIGKKSRDDGPFVFTFIGSREPRKNIDVLLECFSETFQGRPDVLLRIHCALDFFNNADYADGVMRRYSNVHFTCGVMDDDSLKDVIRETDCFVSLSKGEGYSIVPRQFLAAGRPVILSDCFAHSEILRELEGLGSGLGFAVDASIPVPGEYRHINGGGVFGLQYDVYKPSVCQVLLDVFRRRASLTDEGAVSMRRQYAMRYDQRNLAGLYKSIIQPAFCRMSTGDELEFGGITTSDANLASRITGRNYSLSGIQQVGAAPKKVVVMGNDGGFFSVFNRFVSYLTWTLAEHPGSVVLPDWRIDAMQRHWGTTRFTSFCYGRPEDGNIWLKLFKPLPYANTGDEIYNSDRLLYDGAELHDDYNEKNEPWLTYVHPYKLYRSPGFERWRHWYHLYLSANVHLQDHIQQKIDAIHERHLKGYRVISAHIRHPSHGIEQAGARMPTVDLFCEFIRETQGREGLNQFNSRIFLATDQDSVVEKLKSEFGDMVVYASDAARTTEKDDAHFNSLSAEQQMQEGFQIQHLTAADPNRWTTKMAEEVIVDTYLLARGDYFIHVTSNIATAVSFINPRIKMVYCE